MLYVHVNKQCKWLCVTRTTNGSLVIIFHAILFSSVLPSVAAGMGKTLTKCFHKLGFSCSLCDISLYHVAQRTSTLIFLKIVIEVFAM